ncbi:MAG: T9SS type A sorting domain-containing protein, partial [Flavitalea sp.]
RTTSVNFKTNEGCFVTVTTDSSYIGARIQIFVGSQDITIGRPTIQPSDGYPANGGGAANYPCEYYTQITDVTITKGGQTCFSLPSNNINLPIKLSAFSASLKGGSSVELNWNTVLESNSASFGVEKSVDGKSFTTIGVVKAAGNSSSLLKYAFEDKSFAGTAYYRLRLLDLDGKSEYSAVRYVNGGPNAATSFSVFPNPFRSDIQLKGINASDVNKTNIRVFSATGKQVGYKITGANSISIDASLPKGVYILRVKDQTYKLVKE